MCNNTFKHAEASEISLECHSNEDMLEIIYRDNGKGIAEAIVEKGIGMMNIESRIQILDGSWQHVPSVKGVCFKLKIPYATETNIS